MDYSAYIEALKSKRIGVIGYGVSNRPLVRVLLDAGCDVTVCDKRSAEALGEAGEELLERGGKLCSGEDYLEHLDFDVIFRTPGLLPTAPQLVAAAAKGTVLTSEMEAFCALCPCRIVAGAFQPPPRNGRADLLFLHGVAPDRVYSIELSPADACALTARFHPCSAA